MPDYETPEKEPQDTGEAKKYPRQDPDFIARSKKRFELCEEAEKELRELALDDLKFRAGEQWPEPIKQRMIQEKRPALTINVLPARERLILNEQRQNRQAIKVSPVDDQADEDTAEVMQGMIRHIEYDSGADAAYDTGQASSVRGGFGWIRLITEFESETSFRQVIKIKRVLNPFQIYLDPGAQEPDGSDAEFGFVFEVLTKDEFLQQYPDSALAGFDNWNSVGDKDPNWLAESGIRILEYIYKEYKKETLYEVENQAGEKRTLLKSEFEAIPAKTRKRVKIVNQRETDICTVKWCKHSAEEILEETVWPGKWLGLVPIYGDELQVDGKRILEGMVRHAKDPMRMQNYMASKEVQAIALAPNAPFKVPYETLEKFPQYNDANITLYNALPYLTYDAGGRQLSPPERDVAEPPIQAITVARAHFMNDFEQVTGIYQAQQGAPSNEVSGKAVLQRKTQGELANFNYIDNLTRALRFLGRQIIDLIPKVYDTPQMIRIIGEDGAEKVVKVNEEFQQEDGSSKKYDLTIGRYDVTVSTGPSFQTKRQQSVDSMVQLTQAYPELIRIIGDLLVKNMDWPGHEEMAERLRRSIPPELLDKTDPQAASDVLRAENAQLKQAAALLQQEMGKLQLDKAGKVIDNQYKLQMAQLKNDIDVLKALITAKSQRNDQELEMFTTFWKENHQAAHERGMQAEDHAHEKDTLATQAQIAQSQAQQTAQNQSAQSAQDHAQGMEAQAAQPTPDSA